MLDPRGSGSGDDDVVPGLAVWMSVCSKEFGEKEAEVVCRELECGSRNARRVHPNR